MTRNYLTLWFDHGTNPVNGSYAYVLLPGKTAAAVKQYAGEPGIEIVENTPEIQAVKHAALGLTAANFWNDGKQSVGLVTVDRKSAVLIQATAGQLAIAVSDPTQTNMASIQVVIRQTVGRVISLDPEVTVNQLSPSLQFAVYTAKSAGKSIHASFALNPHQVLKTLK